MSGVKDYAIWLERVGRTDIKDLSLIWEFFADHLDSAVAAKPQVCEYDLFVAHAWGDVTLAENIVRKVELAGVSTWFVTPSTAHNETPFYLYRYLSSGISSCRHGLAIVNKSFLERKWFMHEARGLCRNGMLKFIILDQVEESEALSILDTIPENISILDASTLSESKIASLVARGISSGRKSVNPATHSTEQN